MIKKIAKDAVQLLSGILLFCVLFPYSLVVFPNFSASYVKIAWAIGIVGAVAFVWRKYSPKNIWPLSIVILDWIILFALFAIRAYSYIFPDAARIWAFVIGLSTLASYSIPLVNPGLTWLLRRELMFPETSIGKKLFRVLPLVFPMVGAIAALVAGTNKELRLAVLGGTLFWMLAIILPMGIYDRISPFEKNE